MKNQLNFNANELKTNPSKTRDQNRAFVWTHKSQ